MLLRRLAKGARRYSVAAVQTTAGSRFETSPHVAVPAPLRAPLWDRVEQQRAARPLTLLPTPLPEHETQDDAYFPTSKKQQSLAVIAACLRDLYDVRRAETVFRRLRNDAIAGLSVLTVDTYNAVMLAYAQLQAEGVGVYKEQADWAGKLWDMWNLLVNGDEGVRLNPTTVAIAFLAIVRAPTDLVGRPTATDLLQTMLDQKIAVVEMLGSQVLASPNDLAETRNILLLAAQELGRTDVQEILERSELYMPSSATARRNLDVGEIRPVQVRIKDSLRPDGTYDTETPFNLRSLQNTLTHVQHEPETSLQMRQVKLEEHALEATIDRLNHEMEKLKEMELAAGPLLAHVTLQTWMSQWMKATEESLKNNIPLLAKSEERFKSVKSPSLDCAIAPFLRQLPESKLAVITILELMRLHGTGGVAEGMKTGRALVSVGRAVEIECRAMWNKRLKKLDEQGEPPNTIAAMPEWTQNLRVRLGSYLIDQLMANAMVIKTVTGADGKSISEEQPAFMHAYEYIRGKKLGIIRLNNVVNERMARDSVRDTIHPRHLPMLVRPRPWEGPEKGGYLTLKSSLVRIKDSFEQYTYLQHAAAAGHLDLVYECLDALGETPWKINENVLNVVLQVWNSGEALAGIPPIELNVDEPTKPEDYDENPRARATYLVRMKGILNDKRGNHSDRCFANYKLEVAKAFVNDEFYLPHNVDFRGRAYPIPPHLNQVGDDLCRGLLLFAEARPLGTAGLRWLKIHLANVFGFDKAPFDGRVQFVEDHMADIQDSARNPLNGKKWWTNASDPWQCLATCMELDAALSSPKPELYESHLPVHQDGTCNGLQHYAALGGDEAGAQHVNLANLDKPADVYSHVASMVEAAVEMDAAAGDPFASAVQGKIKRKIVKQTVMTTVYGVTFVGAREQIHRQLRDLTDVPREDLYMTAAYLAKRVLGCIGDLFSGASQIQQWLTISARLISRSIPGDRMDSIREGKVKVKDIAQERMTSVIWTTALGLPIVQPYRKAKKKQVTTTIQSVFITDPNLPTQVDPVRQSAAFPPNFVHSLDATHMMLTALECRAAAITFASVHDSYWTHASMVDDMSAIIRDTFIALHSSDILGKLRTEFLERYKGHRVPIASLTEKELCSVLRTLAHPDRDTKPVLLAMVLALVKRTSLFSKDPAVKLAEERLSQAELEAGQASVDNAVREVEVIQAEEEEAEAAETEDIDEEPVKKKRGRKTKKVSLGELTQEVQFLRLEDILPMIPEKGKFDVQNIKASQYFFS